MKKKKSTKAKVRNFVRILIILILAMMITLLCCKKANSNKNKSLEAAAKEAFVQQSIMLASNLESDDNGSYTDIESLEDDSDSFVSDAAIKTGKSLYYIRVNYGANCVNIYTKDDEGNYTKPYKAMICSTGKATPKSGTYKITYKYRWLRLFGDVYGQYSTRIVKNILFHSVPYLEQRADTLEYEEYDKLGTTASAGCIRLTVQDSKWIYDNIPSGTYVEFYTDKTNPGPLGKPDAEKISDNEECRNWDPTDPDKNNPWNGGSGIPSITYTQPKKNTTKKTNTSNQNNTKNQTDKNNSTKVDNTNTEKNNTLNNNNNKDKDKDKDKNKNTNTNTNSNTNTNTSTGTNKNNYTNTNTNTNSNISSNIKDDTDKKPVEPPATDSSNPDKDTSSSTQKPTTPPDSDDIGTSSKPDSPSNDKDTSSSTQSKPTTPDVPKQEETKKPEQEPVTTPSKPQEDASTSVQNPTVTQ